MKRIRLSLVGFGVVGQGLAELLALKQAQLHHEFDLEVVLVSVANARHGFIYREEGLDIPTLLALAEAQLPLTQHPEITHWASTLEGLQATEADMLAEVTGTNLRDAEPGISHIRAALSKGMHVITANKGPAALAASQLFALAHLNHVHFRLESTVMAGTPVISTIREGMAASSITAIRGILNGTTNYILSSMTAGRDYAEALAEAQAQGYAEADPTADVEGYDAVAKTLILSALFFGQQLKPEQVIREGITAITRGQVQHALNEQRCIKLISSLQFDPTNKHLQARVEPIALPLSDPLAQVNGVLNAITVQSDTLPEVTIIGPGAGRLVTGQGLLADLLAIARTL